MRIHPAIVTQAAATTAAMMPGRFVLGLGTGESTRSACSRRRCPRWRRRRRTKSSASTKHHDETRRHIRNIEGIAPLLGPDVERLSEVAHDQKVELISRAHSCSRSSEVVDHGTTGIVVDDVNDMAAAVARAGKLEPASIRAVAERRFTQERLVQGYLAAYETACGSGVNGGSRVEGRRRLVRRAQRRAEIGGLARSLMTIDGTGSL